MSLEEYAGKRDFTKTPEPAPSEPATRGRRFFVQRHDASHLHYDFRLEIDGVLKSWAVPKGPSLDPTLKHFAALVEDHPLDYGDFEGNIPKGSYGGGSVMLWDRGTFELIGEETAEAQIARGDLKFRLHGQKLSGGWAMVRMKVKGKGNEWLLIKKKDEASKAGWDVEEFACSVKTGRTQEEIAAGLERNNAVSRGFDPAGLKGAVKAALPGFFAPMGASITEKLPKGDDWIYEVKWDGVRGLVYLENRAITIYTRNNNRCERQYPELMVLPHYVDAEQAVLDGEIVVFDERGVSKFELMQHRIHTQDAHAIARMGQKNPVHLLVFDLLYLDGYDLRKVPLMERKRALAAILKPFPLLRLSDHFAGGGEELLEAARQTGLEGLIAKRTKSVYESRRSQEWLKLKLTSEQEFVIAGYTPGERDTFGSLAIGYYDDDGALTYAGNVGTGFNEAALRDLFTRLQALVVPKKPFERGDRIPKGTVWVKPELVAQVKFANWTDEGRLRAPVYLGLRHDKPVVEVAREMPADTGLKFTNLTKVYFPEDGYTKGDLIRYYDAVAHLIVPHLKDRPLSLKRYPNGIRGEYFFQKNTPDNYPSWLRTETVDGTRYILANDKTTLLYLTNLGCIDQNPWMSRIGSLDRPDFILMDIDPFHCEFRKVVEAALLVRAKLDAIGLRGYAKTTGGDGMHIYVPIEPVYSYEQARSFAEIIARLLAAEHPKLFTTPRALDKREKDRVYFDWMQIAESKTISAPYVVRAHAGAPVSTPLAWDEVVATLHPSQFTVMNAPARFAERGDLFADVLKKPQRLEEAFERLAKLIKKGT